MNHDSKAQLLFDSIFIVNTRSNHTIGISKAPQNLAQCDKGKYLWNLCSMLLMGLVNEMRGYPQIHVWGQFGTPTRNVVVQLMTVWKWSMERIIYEGKYPW
jgi:hypothetical protein